MMYCPVAVASSSSSRCWDCRGVHGEGGGGVMYCRGG